MRFGFEDAPVPVRRDIRAAFGREWERLGRPGTWWTGTERIEVAAAARAARAGGPRPGLPEPADELAEVLGAGPGGMTEAVVGRVAGEVGYPAYVELVGVIARGAAVDVFHRDLGMEAPGFPEPMPGEPSRFPEPSLRKGSAWVPMPSGSIANALALVPAESAAQEDLHGPLYLAYDQMSDLTFERGLTRAQMELVAARTSVHNECFY
jgi:hypothetical protein